MTDLMLVIAALYALPRTARKVQAQGRRQAHHHAICWKGGEPMLQPSRARAALAGRVTLAPLRQQRADDDQGRAHQCCQARHFSEK